MTARQGSLDSRRGEGLQQQQTALVLPCITHHTLQGLGPVHRQLVRPWPKGSLTGPTITEGPKSKGYQRQGPGDAIAQVHLFILLPVSRHVKASVDLIVVMIATSIEIILKK